VAEMKLGIGYIECINCGTYIFPPKDASDVGIENYEEEYYVPPLNPVWIPSQKDLDDINKARQEAGLQPYKSVDEWVADYKKVAINFRNDVKNKANSRLAELSKKIRDAQIIEEDTAIRIVGKRYQAIIETFERGWRLRCPNCNYVLVECRW
jgi:hypothetical protein